MKPGAAKTTGCRRIAAARRRKFMKCLSLTAVSACLFVVVAPTAAVAQDDTKLQLWADYHAHYYRSIQQEWYADAGLRALPENLSWAQAYARPSLRFHRRKHFDAHAGLGLFYTYNEDLADILEVRPWQGIKFKWPALGGLALSHYFRFEQRFSFSDREAELALRLRYKIATKITLRKASGGRLLDSLFMPVSLELFADAGPKIDPLFGSRGRLDVGLGYTVSDDWVGEFHLIVQASRSGLDEQLKTSEIIFRFQMKHLLAAKDYRRSKNDVPE